MHLSTDVVFGNREAPWVEGVMSPCPMHETGRSKAVAEEAVRPSCPGR